MAAARDNLARKPIIIPATKQEEQVVLRVAAYCRVSTDSADQLNSFAAQHTHYDELIKAHDRWRFVDIYADEGITGTSAKKRGDFQRLLNDCRKGKIDKILVKSISRFARNTSECLEAIRELKSLGISVFFEEHKIDTKNVSSEMLTAVLASCAQAESESISQNMKWSIQKRMQNGSFVPSSQPFGYKLVDGRIEIDESRARFVCRMASMYLSGENTKEIARYMLGQQPNFPELQGMEWDYKAVARILRNEKNIGDSLWQKTYRTDTWPRHEKENRGEQEQYYAVDTHPAILDRETYQQIVSLMNRRKEGRNTNGNEYRNSFRGVLICGCCGSGFRAKELRGQAYRVCKRHSNSADECLVSPITEKSIMDAFLRLYFNLKHHPELLSYLLKNLYTIRNRQMLWSPDIVELNKKISDITCQSHALTLLNQQGLVDPDIFITKSNQLAEQLRNAKQQKEKILEREDNDIIVRTKEITAVLADGPDHLDAFDEELFCELIDKIVVESNTRIRFRLKNGLELPERIERTVR